MMRAVLRLPRELGPLGIAALALIAAAAAFQALVLGPMAASNAAPVVIFTFALLVAGAMRTSVLPTTSCRLPALRSCFFSR